MFIKIFLLFLSLSLSASQLSYDLSQKGEHIKVSEIEKILADEKKIDGDSADYATPIAWALYYQRDDLIAFLMKKGANLNLQANFRHRTMREQQKMIGTPLHVALIKKDYKRTKMLLDAGADPYIFTCYGADAFVLARNSGTDFKNLLSHYKVKGRLSLDEKRAALMASIDADLKYRFAFKYYRDLKEGIKIAQKVHKPILLIIMSNSCGACHRYASTTLRVPEVVSKLTDDFIVVLYKSSKSMPKGFHVVGTPTTWILDEKGNKCSKALLGPLSSKLLLEQLSVSQCKR